MQEALLDLYYSSRLTSNNTKFVYHHQFVCHITILFLDVQNIQFGWSESSLKLIISLENSLLKQCESSGQSLVKVVLQVVCLLEG